MIIPNDILEKICKDMIETILFCLNDATKGTIYLVGPMPRLQVVRITSGIRLERGDGIRWGLPEVSDYNYPGKVWEQYQDRPGRVLEAMAWCVERQKSWTADDPHRDDRSVRKQVSGEAEDFHHMEPVLVHKSCLYSDQSSASLEYPLDHSCRPIWKECDYVVAAIIKIHFKPHTIRRGDRSTKIIKKLSQTLGTEMLSQHVRETLNEAQRVLARQRLQSCNVLAHDLRNTLMKMGFVFSAINAEISFLREQWELQLVKAFPGMETRKSLLGRLNSLVKLRLPCANGTGEIARVARELMAEQDELADLPVHPQSAKAWLDHRLRPKWQRLLAESDVWEDEREEILQLLSRLEQRFWMGLDEKLALGVRHLPEDIKTQWPRLAYTELTVDRVFILEEILSFLDHPALDIPHKQQTKKVLRSLKALAEMIPEVEERANKIIYSLRNGNTPDCCA